MDEREGEACCIFSSGGRPEKWHLRKTEVVERATEV